MFYKVKYKTKNSNFMFINSFLEVTCVYGKSWLDTKHTWNLVLFDVIDLRSWNFINWLYRREYIFLRLSFVIFFLLV